MEINLSLSISLWWYIFLSINWIHSILKQVLESQFDHKLLVTKKYSQTNSMRKIFSIMYNVEMINTKFHIISHQYQYDSPGNCYWYQNLITWHSATPLYSFLPFSSLQQHWHIQFNINILYIIMYGRLLVGSSSTVHRSQ